MFKPDQPVTWKDQVCMFHSYVMPGENPYSKIDREIADGLIKFGRVNSFKERAIIRVPFGAKGKYRFYSPYIEELRPVS